MESKCCRWVVCVEGEWKRSVEGVGQGEEGARCCRKVEKKESCYSLWRRLVYLKLIGLV